MPRWLEPSLKQLTFGKHETIAFLKRSGLAFLCPPPQPDASRMNARAGGPAAPREPAADGHGEDGAMLLLLARSRGGGANAAARCCSAARRTRPPEEGAPHIPARHGSGRWGRGSGFGGGITTAPEDTGPPALGTAQPPGSGEDGGAGTATRTNGFSASRRRSGLTRAGKQSW